MRSTWNNKIKDNDKPKAPTLRIGSLQFVVMLMVLIILKLQGVLTVSWLVVVILPIVAFAAYLLMMIILLFLMAAITSRW